KKDLSEIKNDTNERFEDISIYVMPKPSNREENTNNLQYLLNKGGKNKNIKIKFRSGEYKLDTCFIKDSTEIELMDDTILVCDGGESFSGSNHLFRNADKNENTATNYNGNGNIHIHGGTIKNGHIISMIQAKNVIIENINIIDMVTTHAVEIAGCKNVILRNLHFEGKLYSERGDDGKAEIIQIDLATYGNFPWLPEGSSSFNSIINKNITIENCVFKPGKNSFKYHYSSIGSHSRNIENHKNIKITNCYFYNTTQSAIQLYTTDNVIIENNIFNNCVRPISLSDIESNNYDFNDIYINNNRINNTINQNSIFFSYGNNIHINNNIIDGVEERFVYFRDSNNVFINENTIFKAVNTVIFCRTSENVNINDNTILDSFLKSSIQISLNGINVFDISNNKIINSSRTEGFLRFVDVSDYDNIPSSEGIIEGNIILKSEINELRSDKNHNNKIIKRQGNYRYSLFEGT